MKFFDMFFDMAEGILRFIINALESVFDLFSAKDGVYNAEFTRPGVVLSSFFEYGFCLSGTKNMSVKDSYQNAIVVGGTGVGKSSVVLIPSLFSMCSSLIVHDPSGELFQKSAGYLKLKGYTVKILNFANPSISCNYNPIARANSSSEIQKVSSLLVETALGGGKARDPFWSAQAVGLLTMLISILKKQDIQYMNLYNIRHLLNNLGANHKAIDKLFSDHADEMLFSEYKGFLSFDDKVISGVIATCKASLQIFADESVAKVTSSDNLDFMDFRNKPTVLFIQNSVSEQRYFSVLTSLFFEQFFSFLLGRFPNEDEQDIFLLIDEASSLVMPTLPLATANVRKHRSGIMLLLQDFNQLVHNFGKYEADAIRSNCFAKMYFTGQSLETSTELERILGKYEFKDKDDKKTVRSLMTSDEIRMLKINEALLICGHHAPIKVNIVPYYKRMNYRKYSNIPAPIMENENMNDSILLLPLTVPEKTKHE